MTYDMTYDKPGRPTIPVRCVETGQVFESAELAAQHIGAVRSSVCKCVSNPKRTIKGYHWEYVDEEYRVKPDTPKKKPERLRRTPTKTIYEVQEEAVRRTEQTGRLVRYAHIQKEETIQMIRERDRDGLAELKLSILKEKAKRSEEDNA